MSLIKRGLDRVLKPNETLKESFANPKFLLFRVLLQGCNYLFIFLGFCFFHVFSCLGKAEEEEEERGRDRGKSYNLHTDSGEKLKITPLQKDPKQQELGIGEGFL